MATVNPCANVEIRYKGNGTQKLFTFPFTYLSQSHIHVALWDDIKKEYIEIPIPDWSFANPTTIEFNTAPPAPVIAATFNIKIYRRTNAERIENQFYPGSAIRADDLNNNFEQLRLAIQENRCELFGTVSELLVTQHWNKLTITTPDSKGETITKVDQEEGRWVASSDKYVATSDAISARLDPYVQDTKPADLVAPKAEQAGKSWFDQEDLVERYWDPDADAWVTLANTGPEGPVGPSGGVSFKGNIDITLPPPSGVVAGDQFANVTQGNPVAGFTGLVGPIDVGDLVLFTGTRWVSQKIEAAVATGRIVRWRKTAVGAETVLSGADDNGTSLSYVTGNEQVFINGALQTRAIDYTSPSGKSIEFTKPLIAGDVVELHAVQGYVIPGVAVGSITDADVSDTAAIKASKLDLTKAITDASVSDTAAIKASKLDLTKAVTDASVSDTAAIKASKLDLTKAVTDASVSDTAAIKASKLDLTKAVTDASVSDTAAIKASKLSFTQAGTGAVARTVDSKLKDAVSVKDFGAVGDGVADDTAAIQAAINAVKCTTGGAAGGTLAGNCLLFPPGTYRCNTLTINQPIYLKGLGNGQATDSSERSKLVFIGSGIFLDFTLTAGYCLIEGLSLYGTKAGGVTNAAIAAGTYGNVGVAVGQGVGGTWRDVYFENFDIGELLRIRPGDSYAGAYRYKQNCKFKNNTYSVVQLDSCTDNHYIACDFRSNNSTGYIYISNPAANAAHYQTANFLGCMFETIGSMAFDTRGLQIKGPARVRALGCYFEAAAVFVDTQASFTSNSYHRWESISLRIGGGGFIDLDGCSAQTKVYPLPDLADPFWTVTLMTANGQTYVNERLCNKYTFTAAGVGQLATSDYAGMYKISKNVIPYGNFKRAMMLCEVEYCAPAGVTVNLQVTAGSQLGSPTTSTPVVATWTDSEYYDTTSDWRRKVYCLPLEPLVGGSPMSFLSPIIRVANGNIGDVVGIRNVSFKFLAQ